MDDDTRHCRTSRHLPHPPEAVWAALTDPLRLARWWGPAGFRNEVSACDVRPGGQWLFAMVAPDGQSWANHCEFLTLDAPRRLEIRHVNAPWFTLGLTLLAEPGGTRLDWDQCFDDAATAEALRARVTPANEENLDRLAAELSRSA